MPNGPNLKPDHFFLEVYLAFLRAEEALDGSIDRFYMLGGFIVCLRFAGPALISIITPALAHLEIAATPNPALTICLWDSASTKIEMPSSPPWSKDDYLEFGLINGYNTEKIKTLYQDTLNMIDLNQNRAIYWIADARNVPYYHSITPLRTIFNWWINQSQQFIVHAAAVGLAEGGVLITGKGGAGKSTSALSCIDSGLKYLSDENCIISITSKPYVHSLYCTGTLEAKDADKFPYLKSSLTNENMLYIQKAVYLLNDEYQNKLIDGFPIRAVLVPRVSGKYDTSIIKLSSAQTLIAMAPGSLFQLPGGDRKSFRAMADLLRQVPSYALELGTDLAQIPNVIERFLRYQL